jgi:hypothetical protein
MNRTARIFAFTFLFAAVPALRADRGYDRFPRPDQMERIAVLAHEIDEIAGEMRQRTERSNRRPDRYVAHVLGDLHDLAAAAGHFRREVESYRQDPRHTRDDYRELTTAYDAVRASLSSIDPRSYIDRGMQRIAVNLAQLDDYYGYGDRYGRGYRGRSDRYDQRNRYDDSRRYGPPRGPGAGAYDNRFDSRYDGQRPLH